MHPIVQRKLKAGGTLLAKTHELLLKDTRSLYDLAYETKLPFYWLKSFKAGDIANPSVNRIQKLYEHLTGKQLVK